MKYVPLKACISAFPNVYPLVRRMTNLSQAEKRSLELSCLAGHPPGFATLFGNLNTPVGISDSAVFSGQAEAGRLRLQTRRFCKENVLNDEML